MKLMLFVVVLLVTAGVACAGESDSTDASPGISCARIRDAIVIRFGLTKPPTFFGVETPAEEFIYLRYPPKQIDYVGDAYYKDPLILDLQSTMGTIVQGDAASEARVFTAPGAYALRFQDANHVAGESLHVLNCEVEIEPGTIGISQAECGKARRIAGNTYDVGCNFTTGCSGGRSCCTKSSPHGECYCDNCCLASPPPVAQPSPARLAGNP